MPPVPFADTAVQRPTFEQEQEALSQTLTAKAQQLVGKKGGQCVIFVRNFTGVGRDKVSGFARNTKIDSQDPEVGSIIVLKMSRAGHVGVVLFTTDDNKVVYVDSNGQWTQRIAIRSLDVSDPRIKGYELTD